MTLAIDNGRTIGAYRILRLLGEGGMGQVWLAEHGKLGRRAAIKVLHAQYSTQPAVVQRFFDEARAATAISDPGIVQIFDFGYAADGTAFIVMEMLDGESLDQRLRTHGPLPVSQALRLVRQVATSLAAAHAKNIVHRDLKPENIFIVRDPEVAAGERTKLLDFGIAKLADVPGRQFRTSQSVVMGTPVYMSPEQCKGGGKIDHRADLYSLGCVLFQLITGRPPFEADGAGELLVMHMREPAPAPSRFQPTVSSAVDQLVLRCLAKDPAQRFASGEALAAAIEQLLTQPELPATIGAPRASRRRRWAAAIVGAGLGLGLALGITRERPTAEIEPAAPIEPLVAPVASPVVAPPAAQPVVVDAPPREERITHVLQPEPERPRTKPGKKIVKPITTVTPSEPSKYVDTNGDGVPDRR